MCYKMLKQLWATFNSPVTTSTVQQEHRELKHQIRNTEAKIDSVLNRLMREMRDDAERLARAKGS
jgi:hypothetical protein